MEVGLGASDKERDLGERGSTSLPEGSDCESCWLSLLSNAWADALRPGADGRTCAILQNSTM